MPTFWIPDLPKDPTLALQIAMVSAAHELADLAPDITHWHPWVDYFLYCLEEEALHQAGKIAFEAELSQVASTISSRLARGNWSSPREPHQPGQAPNHEETP